MMTKSEYLIKHLDGKGKIYIKTRQFKYLDKLQLGVERAKSLHRKTKKNYQTKHRSTIKEG